MSLFVQFSQPTVLSIRLEIFFGNARNWTQSSWVSRSKWGNHCAMLLSYITSVNYLPTWQIAANIFNNFKHSPSLFSLTKSAVNEPWQFQCSSEFFGKWSESNPEQLCSDAKLWAMLLSHIKYNMVYKCRITANISNKCYRGYFVFFHSHGEIF